MKFDEALKVSQVNYALDHDRYKNGIIKDYAKGTEYCAIYTELQGHYLAWPANRSRIRDIKDEFDIFMLEIADDWNPL